jgi:hypothetical protein
MKSILTLALVVLFTSVMFAGDPVLMSTAGMTWSGGIGLGSILAIVLSWSRNSSVLWAIVHAIFGWLYVIYFVFTR